MGLGPGLCSWVRSPGTTRGGRSCSNADNELWPDTHNLSSLSPHAEHFARVGEDSCCPIRLRRWFSHRLMQARTSTAHASLGKYLWPNEKRHHVSVRCG